MPNGSPSTPRDAPAGQIPLSRADFDALKPRQQGYVSYYQAAWNRSIPDVSPYPPKSRKAAAWMRGRMQAVLEVQEGDEC